MADIEFERPEAIKSYQEANLLEEAIGPSVSENTIFRTVHPFEIVNYIIKF